MAIEEPKYAVSLHEGAYEVRDYSLISRVRVTPFIAQTAQAAAIPTPCTALQSRRSWRQHAAKSRFCGD
jgi:hypothetical protein